MTTEPVTDQGDTTTGKYPDDAEFQLAQSDDAERYYFRTPVATIASTPALDADQARALIADDYPGFAPEDFEEVDGFDADPGEYPAPVDSDRSVNEYDIWMLTFATAKGQREGRAGRHSPRKNPTRTTVERLLDEWDDPAAIPLHDDDALQQADGVGPKRAVQVVGAAVAKRLIERPVRQDVGQDA